MSFFKSVVSALCLGAVLISAQIRRRDWGNNNAGNGLAIADNVLGIVDAALGGYGYGGGWGGGYGGIWGGYGGVPNCRPVNCYGWEYWEPRTCRCERRASRCPFGEIWDSIENRCEKPLGCPNPYQSCPAGQVFDAIECRCENIAG